MRYRTFPPHRLILDALLAAVLLTILGLTSSSFIQDHIPALQARLLACLSRRINQGLPPMPPVVIAELHWTPIVNEVPGRIERIYVTQGSIVHSGDPLIQLDDIEARHRQEAIESRIHFAELDQPRARSDLLLLYRELEDAQLVLGRLTITSPVDGRIRWIAALRPGEMVLAGAAFAVADSR